MDQKILDSEYSFLQQLIDKLPVGIQVFDNSGLTKLINTKQTELLGIEDAGIAISNFNVLTDPYSKANGSADFYAEVYNKKAPVNRDFEADFDIPENQWETVTGKRYFHEFVFPILDQGGDLQKVVAVLQDYSDDKLTNDKLFKSEQRFRSIFENAVSGIAFTNVDGYFVLANKAFQNLVGYDMDELNKLRFNDLTFKDDLKSELDLINCAIESKSDKCRLEKRMLNKSGNHFWVDASIAVIRNNENKPANFLAVLKDIDKKKEALSELSEAHEFNQMIIDTSPVGIVVVNKEGQVVFANNRAEKLLGLKKENIKQLAYNAPEWKITDIDGGPFADKDLPFMLVMESKKPANNIKHAIEWPNGKRVLLSINAIPQLGSDNEFNGMVASIEDITTKVAADNKIKESNNFFNAIISNAAEGLCVCHNCPEYPFVEFTVWNDKMTKITGYTIEEINKLGWYQTMYPDIQMSKKAMERMASMRLGDNIVGEEWVITRKDKEERFLSISTSVIAMEGDQIHVMALMDDVTEKQKAKSQLEEANAKLKALNNSKDRFLAILAHDLRGPLAASVSLAEILEEKLSSGDTVDLNEHFELIKDSVKRSYNLLEDLLDWSQAQRRKTDFNPHYFNFNKLVEKTINSITDIARKKGITINNLVDCQYELFADENMMRTVLRNLISNAIKFSDKGETVAISCKENNGSTNIIIEDNGVGINEKQLAQLFKIDKNISTRGTNNEKGTGLGLLVCKELVNCHKGEIWAESKVGEGTQMHFTIPKEV